MEASHILCQKLETRSTHSLSILVAMLKAKVQGC